MNESNAIALGMYEHFQMVLDVLIHKLDGRVILLLYVNTIKTDKTP